MKKEESKNVTFFNFNEEFDKLIQSMPGLIWIDTLEEERLINNIMNDINEVVIGKDGPITKSKQNIGVWLWSLASGLVDVSKSPDPLMEKINNQQTTNPVAAIDQILESEDDENHLNIYIMRGLGELIGCQPIISRKLKDIYKILCKKRKIIIITSTKSEIPLNLDKNVTYFSHKVMSKVEITKYINDLINTLKNSEIAKEKNLKVNYNEEELNDIVNACLGLSENEIRKVLNIQFNKKNKIIANDITKEKKRIIEKSGILEYWENLESMDNVGGLHNLKEWLEKRKHSLSKEAIDFGLPVPRGILIVGVPGCGKSLTAKATASSWGLPLVRLDIGKIMAGVVGSSENNMRKALEIVESINPCIMWLDEIEKNLSGSSSSNFSDSGTLSRVFGTFTTWLQEKSSYVFVLATANDISQLPPELTRKGRFDDIWYVGLPSEEERKEIFKIQIKKYNRNPDDFDIGKLAKIEYKSKSKSYKYTGAEIEEAIKDSLYTVFDRDPKSNIKTEDIEFSLSKLIPISKTEEKRISKIISDGESLYKNASTFIEPVKSVNKNIVNLD